MAHRKPHPLSSPKLGANWTEEEALNALLCPREGSTPQCDARTLPEGRRGLFIRIADGLSIMFTGHHIKPKSVISVMMLMTDLG